MAVAESAAAIFEGRATPERVAAIESGGLHFDKDLWSQLASANLLSIVVPEIFGGGGLGIMEFATLLIEQGRRVAPVPILSTLAGAMAVANFGTAEQRESLLVDLAGGEQILAVALALDANGELSVPVRAIDPGGSGNWSISGECPVVRNATIATSILVPARDGGGGIGVFIINCDRPGVRIERLESTDRQEHGRILLSDVEVTPRDLIGGTSHGLIESLNSSALNYLARLYTIGLCALQVGVTKQAVALSAGYVSERTQFGKTLSSFQGVALRAADAYIDSEAIEVTMWQAAWKMAEGLDCDEEISVAKWWASEAGHRVVHAAQHLHGGMGADITYPIHRYFLWGKQIGLEMGSGSSQLVRLGIQLVSP